MANPGVGPADDELGFFLRVDAHAPGFPHALPANKRDEKANGQEGEGGNEICCRVEHSPKCLMTSDIRNVIGHSERVGCELPEAATLLRVCTPFIAAFARFCG